jgi:hypothetical protein
LLPIANGSAHGQQAFHGDILIDSLSMDADPAADEPPLPALFRCRIAQARKPLQGNSHLAPICESNVQRIFSTPRLDGEGFRLDMTGSDRGRHTVNLPCAAKLQHGCKAKAGLESQAGSRGCDGGAGNRTPVRDKIDHSAYVRSPPIVVSSRWPMGGPLLDESSRDSPAAGRLGGRLAQFCDTRQAASGGLPSGQVRQPKLRSQSQVVVGSCIVSRGIYQDPRTWARSHGFPYPVEASRPLTLRNLDAPGTRVNSLAG